MTTRQDLLDEATRSLRDESVGAADGGTLDRVFAELGRRHKRRRVAVAVCVQISMGAVALGAWAGVSGRLDPVLQAVGLPPIVAAKPRAISRRMDRIVEERAAPEDVPPAAPSPEPAIAEAPKPLVPLPRAPRPASPRAATRAPEPTPQAPTAEEIFERAHEAHFVRRDYAAALVEWERYLALGPAARLTLEARYNRALALVRLGRTALAIEALRPFVLGEYGSYRQEQARALTERLAASPP